MAEASKSKLQITPKKYITENKYCCFLCGTHLPDAKRRARISSSLAQLLSDILERELDTIDVRGYLCNDDCYKKINRFTTLRTSLAELSKTLKERNAACNASMRCKRGLPSDVRETFASAQRLKSRNVVQSLNFQKIAPNSTRFNLPPVAQSNGLNYSNLPPFQGCSVLLPRPSHAAVLTNTENLVCKVKVSLRRIICLQ